MEKHIYETKATMGQAAAAQAAEKILSAIETRGSCRVILATGASQFDTLAALVEDSRIDWNKVACFHLDEYVGMPTTHNASFRKYLKERFVDKIDGPAEFHFVIGDAEDVEAECARLDALIQEEPVDVACIGIGENCHIAFNDPPADFDTERPFIVVELDEACRKQQFGEGWFETLDAVPTHAISMSVKQIMKANCIVCSVPDERKAEAARACLNEPVSNLHPATILREHPDCHLFLDEAAASLLGK